MTSRSINPATLDIVLLTAGESSRLGQPKQHVSLGGQSLLERAVALACDLSAACLSKRKPIVISGAYLQQDCIVLAEGNDLRPIAHYYNSHWRQGLAASLNCARPIATADGVMVLLVDQYRLQLDDLLSLHSLWLQHPERAVTASYANTVGPPVIWPRRLWTLPGKQPDSNTTLSKSQLLASNPGLVAMPNAEQDLDSPNDLLAALEFGKPAN